jgi:hypothetical protein
MKTIQQMLSVKSHLKRLVLMLNSIGNMVACPQQTRRASVLRDKLKFGGFLFFQIKQVAAAEYVMLYRSHWCSDDDPAQGATP